jgi:hypothetical protein
MPASPPAPFFAGARDGGRQRRERQLPGAKAPGLVLARPRLTGRTRMQHDRLTDRKPADKSTTGRRGERWSNAQTRRGRGDQQRGPRRGGNGLQRAPPIYAWMFLRLAKRGVVPVRVRGTAREVEGESHAPPWMEITVDLAEPVVGIVDSLVSQVSADLVGDVGQHRSRPFQENCAVPPLSPRLPDAIAMLLGIGDNGGQLWAEGVEVLLHSHRPPGTPAPAPRSAQPAGFAPPTLLAHGCTRGRGDRHLASRSGR